jgi:hypothetical protein
MADGIRLDLQEALARGPGSIPNLEPLFAPGAIPPTFDEAPEVQEGPGFIPGGGIPGVSTGTFTGEPIDIGSGSIGQPVPPVKQSRGDRLRALLGNFLQNFGTGLQAASRAPSGAEFAAGFGGALGAGEERRQQKSREELLRANQASREQQAREIQELRESQFAFQREQSEAARIERDLDRAESARRFEEIGRRQTRGGILERNRARRGRAGQREFLRGQQRERLGATAEQGRLGRQLKRELAAQRGAAGAKPLTPDQAFRQARLEIDNFVREDSFKTGKDKLFAGEEGIKRFQRLVDERVTDLLGRKPTQEELKEVFDQAKVDSFLADIERAKKADFSEDDLRAFVARLAISGEINSTEEKRILDQAGLVIEAPSQAESFRSKIGRREQIEESRKTRIPGTRPAFLRKIR